VADRLGLRRTGTLTAAAATSLTSATYPWKTNRTDAPSREVEGAEIYITSGTPPVPNPNAVSSYQPATGIFTPAVDYSTVPTTTASFDLYGRGVLVSDIQDAVNRALRKIHYECMVPLSLIRDGDMSATGTADWVGGLATLTKAPLGDEDHLPGAQKLHIEATAPGGTAIADVLLAGAAQARGYQIAGFVRGIDGAEVTLELRGAAHPDSQTVAAGAWTYLQFPATIPETNYGITASIRINVTAAFTTAEAWGISVVPVMADMMPAPEFVTDPDQVRQVYTLVSESDPRTMKFIPARWWDTVPAPQNSMWPMWVAYAEQRDGLPWAKVTRSWSELTSDSATTQAPRDLIELAAAYEVLEYMANRPASMEINKWSREIMPKIRGQLLHESRRHGSDTVVKINLMRPFGG
jgi:hypothetical protein